MVGAVRVWLACALPVIAGDDGRHNAKFDALPVLLGLSKTPLGFTASCDLALQET